MRDLLANRVLAQLAAVARTRLADLPPQRSFRLDAFVAAQAALTTSQASVLTIRHDPFLITPILPCFLSAG